MMTFDIPHDEPPDKEEYEAWEKEHMSDDGIEPKEFPSLTSKEQKALDSVDETLFLGTPSEQRRHAFYAWRKCREHASILRHACKLYRNAAQEHTCTFNRWSSLGTRCPCCVRNQQWRQQADELLHQAGVEL